MRKLFIGIVLALAACASQITPSGSVAAAYEQVRIFQVQVGQTVTRGAISPAQGRELVAEGEKARVLVDKANEALLVCGAKPKCFDVDNLLNQMSGNLAEAERRLRQAEKK